jgi:hypothetical protein
MTTLFVVIAGIFGLLLVMTMLMGNEMKIERFVTINKPAQQIFDFVKISKNHDQFST